RSTVRGLCGWLVLAVSQHCSNSPTHAPASLPSSAMRRWPAVSWTVILSIGPPSLPSSAASARRQGIPFPAQSVMDWAHRDAQEWQGPRLKRSRRLCASPLQGAFPPPAEGLPQALDDAEPAGVATSPYTHQEEQALC